MDAFGRFCVENIPTTWDSGERHICTRNARDSCDIKYAPFDCICLPTRVMMDASIKQKPFVTWRTELLRRPDHAVPKPLMYRLYP